MRSNDSAEIRTPLPNAMIAAMRRCGSLSQYPAAAPSKRADPARKPHAPACNQPGINAILPASRTRKRESEFHDSMFNPEAISFLRELKDNNDREWFQPRKEQYEALLRS